MKEIIRLIRPHQWIKNLVVLFPIFFGKALGNIESLYEGCITMIAFSFIASSIYCLNDIVDVADDRRHPKKRNRPLASGKISIAQGYAIMGIMVILSMVSLLFLPQQRIETGGVIGFYWALNVAYCLYLKQHAIIAFPLICQTPRRCLAYERNRRSTKKEHHSLQSNVHKSSHYHNGKCYFGVLYYVHGKP